MTQQYYYSSLTGPQLDAALTQLPQAAATAENAAAAAAASSEAAENYARAAADSAARADSYSKAESDSRFAPAIVLKEAGTVLTLPWAAPLPLEQLNILGITEQSGTPAPEAPLAFPENPKPRVILAGKNLWRNEAAVIETGGSCWSATDTGFQFRRGDYTGTGCLYVPIPIPKGQSLRFRCMTGVSLISCCLYGDGIFNNLLVNSGKASYSFTADRDYPNAVAALILPAGSKDVEISNIRMTFGEEAAFTPGKPLRILETGQALYGIPMQNVCTRHNFTDPKGRKWYTDEIDFARGVYIQRCYTVTFDGTEPWYLSSTGLLMLSAEDYERLRSFDTGTYDPDAGNCAYHICSHFQSVPRSGAGTDGTVSSYGTIKGNSLQFVDSAYNGNLEGWKQWLAQQAAAGTPVTMVLGRRNPVETALSRDVMEAFRAMTLDPGENLLYNDASAMMQLSYVADTGLYIDSKLAAISTAILN